MLLFPILFTSKHLSPAPTKFLFSSNLEILTYPVTFGLLIMCTSVSRYRM